MNAHPRPPRHVRRATLALPCLAGVLLSTHALAYRTELADGTQLISTTNLSYGAQWRAQDAKRELIGPAYGGTSGSSANDDGNLNYGKGDIVSSVFKVITDVELKKDNVGALVRAKGWYDSAWNDGRVQHGSTVAGYDQGRLSDRGFASEARFSNVVLLDAYAYANLRLAESDLSVRIGKQVLNWGESTFFQGLNQTNPLDVPALRRPGAQVKEGLIPVETAYFNWSPSSQPLSVEGFYQWKFRPYAVDGCGTYFSTADIGIANSCRTSANLGGALSAPDGSLGYLQRADNTQPGDGGQFGLALNYTHEPLDLKLGLYAMNLHSGIPIFSAFTADASLAGLDQLRSLKYKFEYPGNVQRYGATLATTVAGGWSLGVELSHSPNLPAQINGVDMFYAALGASFTPLGDRYAGAAAGTYLQGYRRVAQSQLLVNTMTLLSPMWGATGGVFLAEIGYQRAGIDDPAQPGVLRYGRSFNYGANIAALCPSSVAGQCSSDGYATPNAYGYRLYGQLNYTTPIGVSVKPGVYFAHDLRGWSVDGQLSQGRRVLGLSLRMERSAWWAEASAVGFNRNATYDDGRDRAFYGVSAGTSF
jgi:hypothetical protein